MFEIEYLIYSLKKKESILEIPILARTHDVRGVKTCISQMCGSGTLEARIFLLRRARLSPKRWGVTIKWCSKRRVNVTGVSLDQKYVR